MPAVGDAHGTAPGSQHMAQILETRRSTSVEVRTGFEKLFCTVSGLGERSHTAFS